MSAEDDDFWAGVTEEKEKKKTQPEPAPQPKETPAPQEAQSVPSETPKEETPALDDPFFGSESENKPQEEQPQVAETSNIEVQEESVASSTTVTETVQPEPATVQEPFETSATEESVVEKPSPAETPAPPEPVEEETTKEDPFGESKDALMEKEFKDMKPATSAKNISFMIFGKKGTTKTSTAMSLPGRIFAISMDQQTAIIWEEFFNKNSRIEVWDGIEFFNSKNPETKLETAVKTVEYVNWLLENPCKNFKPDWILIDGTERLSHVCEMAMRAQENLLPYEGVKNRNAWKYRNDLINNIVQRATQIAKLGVVYTAFTSIETVTTATGEEKREGPKWAGDIEQKTQIVIKTSSHAIQGGRAFVAEVESSKVSFIPTGRRMVVGERMDSGEIRNNIGIKGLFTPEGVKKFWTGGEQ